MNRPELDISREPGPLPGEADQQLDIHEHIQLILGKWRLIAAVCLLVLGVAVVKYFLEPKLYRATTVVQIEQRSPMSMNSRDWDPWLAAWAQAKYYPTQYRLLESRGLAERVVLSLRLADDPKFNPGRARLPAAGEPEETVTAAADDKIIAGLAGRILGGLSVKPIRDTELVEVSYVSPDPELAARIANGLIDAFIDWGIETRSENVGKASTFLSSQIETLKQEIDEKERQLQQYSRNTDILRLDPSSDITVQRLERLNDDLAAAIADRLKKQARHQELSSAPDETVADQESGGLVSELQREQIRREREYQAKLTTYKPDWPEMVELKARIDEGQANLDRLIRENVTKARQSASAAYQSAVRLEKQLEEEIAKVKSQAMDVNYAAVEFRNLDMEIGNRRELLDDLFGRLSDAGVSARLQSTRESNVRVVDKALVPGGPFRPSLRKNVTLGLAIGLLFGVGLVLGVHFLDRTVKSGEELERLLGLPLLSVIPDVAHSGGKSGYGYGYGADNDDARRRVGRKRELRALWRRAGRRLAGNRGAEIELLPHHRSKLGVSEAYRSLRTALLLSSAQRLKVITVTSAKAGEGKTATATNLAVVLAQLGRPVLVVGADLRKPRLYKVFKVSNRTGLVNFLTSDVDPSSIIHETSVPNLYVCPSSPHPLNPSELLASGRMEEFLTMAKSRFEYVILDTPPALVVTDAVVCGAISDGVVHCFLANKILREEAMECRDTLLMADVKVLGTVLNRRQPDRGSYYDRRYYYYYEGYSDTDAGKAADSAA